ncbi:MAG: hypothetical protein HY747_12420 [Elusimicrobia bacterium]|nr:hypothetical protein [Elusimicrobiota bacterium]
MNIELSPQFERAYRDLPEQIKKKIKKAVFLLENNPRHPSLRIEKIDLEENIWSGRVDRNHRFTFQWIPGGVRLRKVGSHQNVYRKP